jgi:hypothetical protein
MEWSLDEKVSMEQATGRKREFAFGDEDEDARVGKRVAVGVGGGRFGTDGFVVELVNNVEGRLDEQGCGGLGEIDFGGMDFGGGRDTIVGDEDLAWRGGQQGGLDEFQHWAVPPVIEATVDAGTLSVVGPRTAISGNNSERSLEMASVEVAATELATHDEATQDGRLVFDKKSLVAASKADARIEYDTCFGVVCQITIKSHADPSVPNLTLQVTIEATLSTTAKPNDQPLSVKADGAVIKLYDEKAQFAGLFVSEAIGSLVANFSVHLIASFTQQAAEKANETNKAIAGRKTQKRTQANNGLTRVTIYGLMSDKGTIGKRLSDSDLYLQHPLMSEYDSSMPYYNPHLLLRPGTPMPRIQDLSIEAAVASSPGQAVLDEVSKARIWRTFDLANGDAVVPEVKPSLRLKSELRRSVCGSFICRHRRPWNDYELSGVTCILTSPSSCQLAALGMMIERESGIIDGAKFPTLWQPSAKVGDPRQVYGP